MYDIIFDEEAIDFLEKLPAQVKERIFNKIISTKENPLHFFERLVTERTFIRKSENNSRVRLSTASQRISKEKTTFKLQYSLSERSELGNTVS